MTQENSVCVAACITLVTRRRFAYSFHNALALLLIIGSHCILASSLYGPIPIIHK